MAIRVLVVDDEEDFLQALVMRLALRELDAHGVESGAAALDHLAERPTDVVVLDIKMPGLDGIETLRQIRERHPEIAVIVLTGHASEEFNRRGRELGAFEYLVKPVRVDTLVAAVRRASKDAPHEGAG